MQGFFAPAHPPKRSIEFSRSKSPVYPLDPNPYRLTPNTNTYPPKPTPLRPPQPLSPTPAQPKIDTENSSIKSQPKKYPQKNRYLNSLLQNPKISKSAINRWIIEIKA